MKSVPFSQNHDALLLVGRRSCLPIPLVIAIALALTGCMTVGPDFRKPETEKADFSDLLMSGTNNADSSQGPITRQILAQWWKTMNDPILTDLIQKALIHSQDIKAAQASVREARYRLGMSRAGLFPQIDSSGAYVRSQASENMLPDTGAEGPKSDLETDFYQAGFDATWEIDIFGGTRRGIEAARADMQAREENLSWVWVSLAGEIARSYIGVRTYQERLRIANANLQTQAETLQLLESRLQSGLSDELAVLQSRYIFERTRSVIPSLNIGLEAAMNALAVLTGAMPGELHALLCEPKPIPVAGLKAVTGIPADTLRQRPDVRLAERQLAAQTARIGQAKADLFPKFHLVGSIGLESLDSETFFQGESKAWSIGPSISWPVFHAGSIRNNVKAQTASQERLLALYEKAVLNAAKEVRDGLTAYALEQKRHEALVAAVQSAQGALQVSLDKYKQGLSDFNNTLDAQRSLLSLQEELAITEGMISDNLVQLYKALGGGWGTMKDEAIGKGDLGKDIAERL
ncbi:MAG: efflux transporter outer membrane subunit [Alphaproteobacteria bacterium]